MAKLHEVVRARRQTAVDITHPGHEVLEVLSSQAEGVALSWVVHVGGKVDIVNLGAEIELASTEEQPAGHPVNVAVLEEVGGGRPLSCP